ncbi:MAG: hypothetical protein L0I24_02710 [Pseudonocardia sp.]|nr:hypothetical protein [Pseudonocardia sp.]
MSSWTTQLRVVGDNDQLSHDEKRDLMQTIVQAAIDAVTASFSAVSGAVISEMQAGGMRAARGKKALVHVQEAMTYVESWARKSGNAKPAVIMTELLDTILPLQKAYSSIV